MLARWARASAVARDGSPAARLDLRYGDAPKSTLENDVFLRAALRQPTPYTPLWSRSARATSSRKACSTRAAFCGAKMAEAVQAESASWLFQRTPARTSYDRPSFSRTRCGSLSRPRCERLLAARHLRPLAVHDVVSSALDRVREALPAESVVAESVH